MYDFIIAQSFILKLFEIPYYGSKSDVGQRARLLLVPGSPSYNNKKT